MPRTTTLGALALALLLPALAAAQPPAATPEAEFEAEVEVTEVLLDVLVTDERGNVVIGLGPDDFVVEEQGEPVELTGVTFYSNRRFVESPELAERIGVDTEVAPLDRYFVLFFQDDRALAPSLASQYLDLSRFVRRWLGDELLPNDQVAVVSYDVKLKVWQDFTSDKEEVAEAILAIFGKSGRKPLETWPSRVGTEAGPTLLAGLPEGRELRRETRKIYDGLRLLGEALDDFVGRKNLIFFSLGFGEVREFGVWTPDPRYYPDMVRTLNDNNVAVYPVDLISTVDQGTIQDRGNNQALSQLASDTGGRYYFQFASFESPLEEIAEENNGYYLLSYRSEHPTGESGYREVSVDTVNETFDVRAREGYQYGDGE